MPKLPFLNAIRRILDSTEHSPAHASKISFPMAKIGMVSVTELRFFSESAALYLGKEGAIVDLGCWLGSTSIALAKGISSNSSHGEKVLAFDRFQWQNWMPADIPYCRYTPGESFLPEARRIASDHGDGRVELIQADLANYKWLRGPIKILLVDVMKTENLAIQIGRNFFPSLVPGSLLIHQDFKHYFTSWIHLIHYRLREYFSFYRSVPVGTVAFQAVAPIPQNAVEHATELMTFPDDEIDSAFRYSLELVQPEERVNIAAAHVMYYLHAKRKDAASRTVELYRPLAILDKGEFPKALNFLSQIE